jgi:nucleotide-binding universal stress UspA family protein
MLDMERLEVLALLENKPQATTSGSIERRSASPYATARSPVRSMLDIEEEPDSSSNKVSPPRQGPVRSMLDMDAPPPPSRSKPSGSSTVPNSPTMASATPYQERSPSQSSHYRSMSDAAFKPVDFGPRASAGRNDPTSGYQFSGIYNQLGGSGQQQMPLRAAQKSSMKKSASTSLGEALRSPDLSGLQLPGERGRNSSISGLSSRLGRGSKSPNNRPSSRSRSPATFAPQLPAGKAYLNDGQVLDINNAYRRLSDANLAFSGGSLSQFARKKQHADGVGEGRLIKDYLGPDGEHLGSSEEDEPYSTDDEDRGRKKTPRSLDPDAVEGNNNSKSRSRSGMGERKTLSLLAAAEEESKCTQHRELGSTVTNNGAGTQIASKHPYQYKSLIPEPEIKITNSSGENVKPNKHLVHPHTSYDHKPGSATPSVMDSDEEAEIDDIKRAQKLSFSMTNIINNSETARAIRIIYRGEYQKIAQVAEDEQRRLRKYLVATDLSDESAHALEWAIGTVLRDGDTLVAIYCVDEETGIVTGDGAYVADDAKAMKEQAAAITSMANSTSAPAPTTQVTDFRRQSKLGHIRGDSTGTPGASPAPSGRGVWNKAEEERHHAVKDITDRVLRLLRKTQLQVRVVVEVLHCKNPKHLITEVIDHVSPTLVVIGSRGRSALKG